MRKRKLVYGIGINDVDYIGYPKLYGKWKDCKYHRVWTRMLERSYCNKFKKAHPTYKDCTVCDEWIKLSVFMEWMKTQDWQDKQLDKDLIFPDNKHYSPKTCVFVSGYINSLIQNRPKKLYPMGVSFDGKTFGADITDNGTRKRLGRFKTKQKAIDAYIDAKAKIIKREARNIIGPQSEKIKIGLLNRRIILLSEHSNKELV